MVVEFVVGVVVEVEGYNPLEDDLELEEPHIEAHDYSHSGGNTLHSTVVHAPLNFGPESRLDTPWDHTPHPHSHPHLLPKPYPSFQKSPYTEGT